MIGASMQAPVAALRTDSRAHAQRPSDLAPMMAATVTAAAVRAMLTATRSTPIARSDASNVGDQR